MVLNAKAEQHYCFFVSIIDLWWNLQLVLFINKLQIKENPINWFIQNRENWTRMAIQNKLNLQIPLSLIKMSKLKLLSSFSCILNSTKQTKLQIWGTEKFLFCLLAIPPDKMYLWILFSGKTLLLYFVIISSFLFSFIIHLFSVHTLKTNTIHFFHLHIMNTNSKIYL